MTESVYVNKDRSKVVDESSPEAAFKIHRKEAEKAGLLKKSSPAPAPDPAATDLKTPRRAASRGPKRAKE
jgi:hypothetical protein